MIAKLSIEQQREITDSHRYGLTMKELAKQYGVHHHTISKIIHRLDTNDKWSGLTKDQLQSISKENVLRITKRFSHVD